MLLNSDARAEPGAVHHLVRKAAGKSPPFAIMGRPVVSRESTGRWGESVRWMWELHHEFHSELLAGGYGGHLSDELLMVSLEKVPPIPTGIINDGAYFAIWLAQHGGGQWYAPEARVSIQVPSTLRDHLRQRRRIHVGNWQLTSTLGTAPASIPRRFLSRPPETVQLLRRMVDREGGVSHLARIAAIECASYALAAWDRLPPRKDHVHWERIQTSPLPPTGDRGSVRMPDAGGGIVSPTSIETRVESLLRVAEKFGTGVLLDDLLALLPLDGPKDANALRCWLDSRPDLVRVADGRAFLPTSSADPPTHGAALALSYRRYAEELWSGPLSFVLGLVRCAGVTGSVAYGNPHAGDDLDLFVVPRTGALWWLLARTYFELHLARRRDPRFRGPAVCLNYVLEEGPASAEFGRRSDLLFAREALNVQLLHGEDYFRGLVAGAPWIRTEIPRLYDARIGRPGSTRAEPAPRALRLLNALVYPILASYLQLVGLARNSRFRRQGTPDREFRTDTRFRRVAFASQRFEELRDQYREDPRKQPRPLGGTGGVAVPAHQ